MLAPMQLRSGIERISSLVKRILFSLLARQILLRGERSDTNRDFEKLMPRSELLASFDSYAVRRPLQFFAADADHV